MTNILLSQLKEIQLRYWYAHEDITRELKEKRKKPRWICYTFLVFLLALLRENGGNTRRWQTFYKHNSFLVPTWNKAFASYCLCVEQARSAAPGSTTLSGPQQRPPTRLTGLAQPRLRIPWEAGLLLLPAQRRGRPARTGPCHASHRLK